MFYANSTFEAYITNWDIRKLCKWVQHVSDLPIPMPKITVHVKLLDRMVCELQLLWVMRLWRDTKHDDVNLEVHDITEQPALPRINQYFLFTIGIIDAENLAMDEDYFGIRFTGAWSVLASHVFGLLPHCSRSRVSEAIYGCDKHGIMVY